MKPSSQTAGLWAENWSRGRQDIKESAICFTVMSGRCILIAERDAHLISTCFHCCHSEAGNFVVYIIILQEVQEKGSLTCDAGSLWVSQEHILV